jgi:hypothetical protein
MLTEDAGQCFIKYYVLSNKCEQMEILLQVCKIFFLLKSCVRFAFSSRSSLTVMDLSLGSLTAALELLQPNLWCAPTTVN